MSLLIATAASVGIIHTILGPDHYLPFIVMAKARGWSRGKTAWVTLLCGLGHVGSSVALGLIGVALGVAVFRLESIESFRGDLAGWAMVAFGFSYMVWGIRRAIKNRPHAHVHAHEDGVVHSHSHTHVNHHSHVHEAKGARSLTPWVLFTIFVLGPCEPLIPILMYPAAQKSMFGLLAVTATFSITTIVTMLGVVMAVSFGFGLAPSRRWERYSHALAGGSILACGVAIQFFGL